VSRSAITIVDTPAAMLTAAVLYLSMPLGAATCGCAAAVAGLVAGLAATAKYPAGSVLAAVLVVIASAGTPLRVRILHGLQAAAGCVVGLTIGMPALFLRTHDVITALRTQEAFYAQYPPTPSYLTTALLPTELGPTFLLLAAIGIGLLLHMPRSRQLTLGWLVSTALLVGTLARYRFQPLRNFLPLLPFACVAAATAIGWLVDRLATPWILVPRQRTLVTLLVAGGLAMAMLAHGDHPYLAAAVGKVDTRVTARAWLEGHVRSDDAVLVVEELAFAPAELFRLGAAVAVVPWRVAPAALERRAFAYVVTGRIEGGGAAVREGWEQALRGWRTLRELDGRPTPSAPNLWRGNDQRIVVYGAPLTPAPPSPRPLEQTTTSAGDRRGS
jgi:hypothetical protein